MKREAGGQGEFSVGRIFGAATPPGARQNFWRSQFPRGAKARPAKSGKKFTGPKLRLNGGCFAIVSYIQDQLDETHRLATFGQLWKITPKIARLG